ncbi:MAG: hypothetical protein ACJAVQ_002157 [Nonlabens sp.]|jgi:hypothetical protein
MPVLMGFISPVAGAVCRIDNINDCDNCTTVAASCEEGSRILVLKLVGAVEVMVM